MSDAKLTPWFSGSVKPVRDGVYEVRRDLYDFKTRKFVSKQHKLEFRDGAWHYTMSSRMSLPDSLAAMGGGTRGVWRGLARNPAA